MRQQLREMLGNLGSRLNQFDENYADKVATLVMAPEGDSSPLGVARSMTGMVVGSPLTDRIRFGHDDHVANTFAERAVRIGVPAASATARYVVPGAMITAAGAGLADLTQNFYDSMSDTPVLPS